LKVPSALWTSTRLGEFDELDQLAGTLALSDPKFAHYLPRAYDYWFTHFVDKEFGEVWNSVDGRTHAPVAPKQWEWKNAYHSFEHALIGYIVGQQLNDQPITLYYAFSSVEVAGKISAALFLFWRDQGHRS